MRIALVGAGSLGTIIGALITKGGEDIILVDTYKEHVDALNNSGATIIGKMEANIPVKACTPAQVEGTFDLIILQTKQGHMRAALENMMPHMHAETVVLTLQNGVPEDEVCDIVGKDRVIGGSVEWGATFISPGVSQMTSNLSAMGITFGELDGTIRKRTNDIKRILEHAGYAHITTNLMGIKYTKLVMNSTFSGMSAALGCTFGDVLDDEKALTCVAYIAKEAAEVIIKKGITAEPIFGFHPIPEKVYFSGQKQLNNLFENTYRKIWDVHRLLKASMLQDLEKGKETEINYINGKVVYEAAKLGIDVPFNKKVVDIVSKIEKKELDYTFDNINLFNIPYL